jgi:hypothetical protein
MYLLSGPRTRQLPTEVPASAAGPFDKSAGIRGHDKRDTDYIYTR